MVMCAVLPKLWLLGMVCLYDVRVASHQCKGRGTWGVQNGTVEGRARWDCGALFWVLADKVDRAVCRYVPRPCAMFREIA
jgi:hypothetical protein